MKKTVVVIDDDSDEVEVFKEALMLVDPTLLCISFLYPDEALRLLTREFVIQPSYIFIDINMPRIPGEVCLELIRKTQELNSATVVIYSTSLPADISERLLGKGANYTFQKPNKMSDYNAILEAIIFKSGFHKAVKSKS